MNVGLIRRAVRRHTQMKDRAAYTTFLEHVTQHGNVWAVPQSEVAQWWERRQRATLALTRSASDRARVSCAERDVAVAVGDAPAQTLPVEVPLSPPANAAPELPLSLPAYDPTVSDRALLVELLGHLGYGHVGPALAAASPALTRAQLDPLLAALGTSARVHQRFDEEPLARLRALLGESHALCGLPDLRLWSLPARAGRPYAVGLSVRYDVDAAIENMDAIHQLEARCGVRSTAYLRPVGYFYGHGEIRAYARRCEGHELALHGEFVTTAERYRLDEAGAASHEKRLLEGLTGTEAAGVCMHGGELRSNTTGATWQAVEAAGFRYETMYRNRYYLPLHLPQAQGVRRTLSIGQHFADISVPPGPGFAEQLSAAFLEQLQAAERCGGFFVPVMHPLYFDVGAYLRRPQNSVRLAAFLPRILATALRMRRDQVYSNR